MRRLLVITTFIIFMTTPALAADRVAFSRHTEGHWQVWTMNPDGTQQTQVTRSKEDKRSPVWVNNAKQLAFRTNNGHLYLINADGTDKKQILGKFNVINNPDFSDPTEEITFVRFHPGSVDISDIWKSDLQGENTSILTKDKVLKYQPRFSSDGRRIVFVKADLKTGAHHLWLINADGTGPRQITQGKGLNTLPDFSPDASEIVFTSNKSGAGYDIYALNLKTKNINQLTRASGLDTHAVFSPDGSMLCFVSNRSGNQQIWIMNTDGSNPKQITQGEEESLDPAWGRSQ